MSVACQSILQDVAPKNYLAKVKGTHGWQLNLPILDAPVDDDEDKIETEEVALIG